MRHLLPLLCLLALALMACDGIAFSAAEVLPTPTADPSPTHIPTATATWPATALPITPTPTLAPPASPTPTTGPLFYVALEGDDRLGDGTRARPWATISHAVRRVPDGATITVAPGVYHGRVDLVGRFAEGITIRAERSYQSALRHTDTVVTIFYAQGITLEGFDIAHTGPNATFYIVQIQDFLRQTGDGQASTSRITLRNNILHDSYGLDILKINNGARQITVEGNLFYNHGPSGHQIDVNSAADILIQDNVFMSDYEGSGRPNTNETRSFVAIKDSNGAHDDLVASQRVILRRNIFLNWQGSTGSHFLALGEETTTYYQARDILVENNLFLGNSPHPMLSAWGIKGAIDVTFRHNTMTGDLPAFAFAMRLNVPANNPPNERIAFYNNLWNDPTGTMGQVATADAPRFALGQPAQVGEFALHNNLYWNGGIGIPFAEELAVNYTADSQRLIGDPYLPEVGEVVLPRWLPNERRFADGSTAVGELFERLVIRYALPELGGAGLDAADPAFAAEEDILQRPRTGGADVGAVER